MSNWSQATRVAYRLILICGLMVGGAGVSAQQANPICPLQEQPDFCIRADCTPEAARQSPPSFHRATQCMRNIRDVWYRALRDDETAARLAQIAETYVDTALLDPPGRAFGGPDGSEEVLEENERGVAFNAMGQGGVAYFLLHFARIAERDDRSDPAAWFQRLGINATWRLVAPVEAGGLTTRTECDGQHCVWFHSITRRDRATEAGGTLNQNLHAIRDLLMILGNDFDLPPELEQRVEQNVKDAMHQLLDGDDPTLPTLSNYFPQGETLAYYGAGLDAEAAPNYYRLREGTLDCHYHIHSTELLFQIADIARDRPALEREAKALLSCASPLWRYDQVLRDGSVPVQACDPTKLSRYRDRETPSC